MTPRWFLKRTLKWGVEWVTELSGGGLIYRKSGYFRLGYRILTYHHIAHTAPDSHSLSINHFRDHIKFLRDHYPVVNMSEMVAGLQGNLNLEKGSVSITFDDGYSEAAGIVAEILSQHNMPACFFVITGVLDNKKNNADLNTYHGTKSKN